MIPETELPQPPPEETLEDIAARVWGIDKHQLFTRTRKRKIVEARMTLMLFRNEKLRQNESQSSQPYFLRRGAVIHARRTVYNLLQTNPRFKFKYDMFQWQTKKYV